MPYKDAEKRKEAVAASKARAREAKRLAAQADAIRDGADPLAVQPPRRARTRKPDAAPDPAERAREVASIPPQGSLRVDSASFWEGFSAGAAWQTWQEVLAGLRGADALDPFAGEDALREWVESNPRALWGFLHRLATTGSGAEFDAWRAEATEPQ